MKRYSKLAISLVLILVMILPLISFCVKDDYKSYGSRRSLPVVGDRQKLMQLLEKAEQQNNLVRGGGIVFAEKGMNLGAVPVAPTAAPQTATSVGDFSATNVQVQGVDEGDIVKTDGKYIYQVSRDKIVITDVQPEGSIELVKTIQYDGRLQPTELYVDDKHMIVIGYANMESYMNKENIPYYFDGVVTVKIYDIADKKNIKDVREIQLEGQYVSSRKIGSEFYIVANRYINYHLLKENDKVPDTPLYRDTAQSNEFAKVAYDKISYFPDSVENNYMIVAGLSLDAPDKKLNLNTYLGAGAQIYCSDQNLYVSVTKYSMPEGVPVDPIIYDSAVMVKPGILPRPSYNIETLVYRFSINKGRLKLAASGTVPGTILNQFSMDEYDGTFRIATTKGELWGKGDNISKNNLYVLDMKMKQIGSIVDIAPGERIYSVRFMGARAYMVTFRQVDPLFVIDLKDKTNPKILGALKIPGYSDYLHPYDENHIIGFGKDTENAFYLGMKVAMFDITDVTKPKELFVEKIGDRGTDSPLLHDHKALLFSKEKNLLAFPVTVMEVGSDTTQNYKQIPAYGSFTFQGAYVYNVDLDHGFQLKTKITHLNDEDYQKAGMYWYNDDRSISRILYIGNNLYTISNKIIKAHDLSTFKQTKSIELK